jgi:FkbM family methyltransferase
MLQQRRLTKIESFKKRCMKELIYKVVDFFTFGKGLKKTFFGYPMRLPTRYINYFPSDYEAENFNFLKQQVQSGDTVLDIGAHIGFFANIAAFMVGSGGKIYAFEPTPSTNVMLHKMCAMNGNTNIITPINKAVGKEDGSIVFYISNDKIDNTNSVLGYRDAASHKPIEIPLTSVDNFVKEKGLTKVDFIKIDVEGAEYDTIRGAAETLKKYRPSCILAIHPQLISEKGDQLGDIYDFVVNAGYRVTLAQKPMGREAFCNNQEMIDLHLYPA